MKQTTLRPDLQQEEQMLLWQKIEKFPIDDPGALLPFSVRLARENNWDKAFTRGAIEEYRKFILLCCISPHGASPSKVVDEVWHLHLIYTQSYWEEFCGKTLNRQLHHQPSSGGAQQQKKHHRWRSDTADLYRITFHTDPPPAFWQDDYPTPSRSRLRSWIRKLSGGLLFFPMLLLSGCNGAVFGLLTLFFIFVIIVVSAAGSSAADPAKNKRTNNGDGSGSCGGGGGCRGGCGGGCGGCGGG